MTSSRRGQSSDGKPIIEVTEPGDDGPRVYRVVGDQVNAVDRSIGFTGATKARRRAAANRAAGPKPGPAA